MTKTANIRTRRNGMTEPRQKRRAFQSAMSKGLKSAYKPDANGPLMDEFMSLLEEADRQASKA